MCEELGLRHQNLLLHSGVRWLSREKILRRVTEVKSEIEIFLPEKNHALAGYLKDVSCLAKLAYLGDIFMHRNELNSDGQSQNRTVVDISKQIVLWWTLENKSFFGEKSWREEKMQPFQN